MIIRFELADKDQFKKDLIEYLKNHQKLKPVRFGFTTDYAESLEYGTGPLNNFQPTVNGGNYTYKTVWNDIYEWAGKKDGKGSGLPIRDKAERKAFTDKVVDRMFRSGMRPHPYWRPAIQWMEDNQQRLFDMGYSLFDICAEALRVADKCIQDQNLPYTGKLQQSALIQELDWREVGDGTDDRPYHDDERNRWQARFVRTGFV